MATRSTARSQTDVGFVLHKWDWSETSVIVDLFTREHGRVALAAKGAKRPYSQLRAVLLPFQRLNVSWSAGRGPGAEVYVLKGAEWAGAGLMMQGEPVLLGFYLNELLMKFLPRQDAHPSLFDAYMQTLPALGARDPAIRVESALRAFELVLLREHGVLPALDIVTATQQGVQPHRQYTLRPEVGICVAAAQEPGWPAELAVAMEHALNDGDLPALQQVCALALADLKVQLRNLLHYHLGHQTLHTRRLMRDLQTRER